MSSPAEPTLDLTTIQQLANKEMQATNELIYQQLKSDVSLINQLGFYIINGGGKRIRPLLCILVAQAILASRDSNKSKKGQPQELQQQHLALATIIEFIHTASLLHDDVVDESALRRGKQTANALFGNSASVLVGDYLYTRAFQLMTELDNMEVMKVLANTTNALAEGEVLQLMNTHDPKTSEQSYLQVIYCKTAKLFEAAALLAALLSQGSKQEQQALTEYGKYLGTAFQLTDDFLDYTADVTELGKNIGDDLAEGKPTLPLIHAMKHAKEQDKKVIEQAIKEGNGKDDIDKIMAILTECGSLTYTQKKAQQQANHAVASLDILAESPYKTALISLAHIAVNRTH